MISVLDRYLLREVLKTLLAFMLVLVLVILATSFIRYLQKVAAGDVAAHIILQLVGLEMLRNLSMLVPPAFFFAILFTLARMHQDSEIVALEACGVGPWRMFRSVLVAAVPVALLVAWLAMSVLPWGNQMLHVVKQAAQGAAAELALIEAGRFNEYSRGDLVFYLETLDTETKTMTNIFVQDRSHGKLGLVSAASGHTEVDPGTGDTYLILLNGTRYEGEVGSGEYRIGSFQEYGVRLAQAETSPVAARRKELSTRELMTSTSIKDLAEAQYRLAQPLTVLAFALLSIPLSRSRPRQRVLVRMILAFFVYFVFLNLSGVSQNLMEDGVTPAALGMWWVPVLMSLVAGVLMFADTSAGRFLRRLLVSSVRR
jgi:lipopolysaccharide export system permease protein